MSSSATMTEIENAGFVSMLIVKVLEVAEVIEYPPPPEAIRRAVLFDIPLNYERKATPEGSVPFVVTYRLFTDSWSMAVERDVTDPLQEDPNNWMWQGSGDLDRWARDLTLLKLYISDAISD